MQAFLSCDEQGELPSSCGVWASHCGGFSCGAQVQGEQASVVAAHGLSSCGSRALEHKLNSCGPQAHLLHGMWNPPRSGIKSMSPALAGRLFTTEPQGKPHL